MTAGSLEALPPPRRGRGRPKGTTKQALAAKKTNSKAANANIAEVDEDCSAAVSVLNTSVPTSKRSHSVVIPKAEPDRMTKRIKAEPAPIRAPSKRGTAGKNGLASTSPTPTAKNTKKVASPTKTITASKPNKKTPKVVAGAMPSEKVSLKTAHSKDISKPYITVEHALSCSTYKGKGASLAKALRDAFPEATIMVNPSKPRSASFDVRVRKDSSQEWETVWNGFSMGPPRKHKFVDPEVAIGLVREHLLE
ncbi:hypothetical protein BASA60_001799 [Batrachochytrium salamandrivorans]|nr:hypothetical protein BASA62_007469 [Batrachochytrium salamandrivorans]KAH6582737.1 hypothetical protein BASA60_001799 [Batrachochytrium salamandrivorans]KAH9268648.1 hypothetical protein BASA83_009282 [Batrachochytrium salamandrivorans]